MLDKTQGIGLQIGRAYETKKEKLTYIYNNYGKKNNEKHLNLIQYRIFKNILEFKWHGSFPISNILKIFSKYAFTLLKVIIMSGKDQTSSKQKLR